MLICEVLITFPSQPNDSKNFSDKNGLASVLINWNTLAHNLKKKTFLELLIFTPSNFTTNLIIWWNASKVLHIYATDTVLRTF